MQDAYDRAWKEAWEIGRPTSNIVLDPLLEARCIAWWAHWEAYILTLPPGCVKWNEARRVTTINLDKACTECQYYLGLKERPTHLERILVWIILIIGLGGAIPVWAEYIAFCVHRRHLYLYDLIEKALDAERRRRHDRRQPDSVGLAAPKRVGPDPISRVAITPRRGLNILP